MRLSSITLGLLVAALAARDAAGQWNVARFGTERSRVYTTFGLDPALVSSVGYGRVLRVLGRDIQFTGDVGAVAAQMDAHDFRTKLSAQASLVQWKSMHVAGSATFITRGTENVIYRGFNFGADFTGTAGVYRQRWFAAGEFGFDKAIITHVTHTDLYRATYPGAKDGWYLDAGGTYHYGFMSGFALGKTEVVGRFGWLRTEYHNDLMSPLYGSVGLGFGF